MIPDVCNHSGSLNSTSFLIQCRFVIMRCRRNVTLVYINWPMVKLVLLYAVSFKVAKPLADAEDLLYSKMLILRPSACRSSQLFPSLLPTPCGLRSRGTRRVSVLCEAGFLGAERGCVFDKQALALAHGSHEIQLGCSFACFCLFPGSWLGF